MRLVDTHAHLCDEQFTEHLEAIVQRAHAVGVEKILNIGTTRSSSELCVAMVERFPQMRAAVGIHPNYGHLAAADDWARIEDLAALPVVAAIGETGLDRYWHDCPWDIQLEYFERHIALAQKHSLPIVVHSRDCDSEMVDFLRATLPKYNVLGVMHSFVSTWEVCQACLDLGMYISFAGQLTYKKQSGLREVAGKVPLDRVLVETDAPYLSPEPFRSVRPNEPARVLNTLEVLAQTRILSPDKMGEITTANAYRLFPRLAGGQNVS
jgi:TatD DNase family protein